MPHLQLSFVVISRVMTVLNIRRFKKTLKKHLNIILSDISSYTSSIAIFLGVLACKDVSKTRITVAEINKYGFGDS